MTGPAEARDRATEALKLRVRIEQAIAQERASGNPELAEAMDAAQATMRRQDPHRSQPAEDDAIALETVTAPPLQGLLVEQAAQKVIDQATARAAARAAEEAVQTQDRTERLQQRVETLLETRGSDQ